MRKIAVLAWLVLAACRTPTSGPQPVPRSTESSTSPAPTASDTPPPPVPPPLASGPVPTAGGSSPSSRPPPPATDGCAGPPPAPDYECVQACGPPVVVSNMPPPARHWLSPAEAQRHRQFPCPICLSEETRIATPRGAVAVSALAAGDEVWTLDEHGTRVAAPLLYAASTPAPAGHALVRLTLSDGRVIAASPGHPALDGTPLGTLALGAALSGATITAREIVRYTGARTWDILPAGATGAYWADGVILRTSFLERAKAAP